MRGFVRRSSSDLIELRTLDVGSDPRLWGDEDGRQTPRYVAGLTGATGTLLLRPTGSSRSKNYGGHRASTREFRFRTIASNVQVGRLRSGELLALESQFPDMLRWAQMSAMSTERDTHEDGRLRSVTIRLDATDRLDTSRLYNGMKLQIRPNWSYAINESSGHIETPLAAGVSVSRPRPLEVLLEPIIDFRLLISLAHGRLVDCSSARIQPHYAKDDEGDISPWRVLHNPHGSTREEVVGSARPSFWLEGKDPCPSWWRRVCPPRWEFGQVGRCVPLDEQSSQA